MSKIQFLDLNKQYLQIKNEVLEEIPKVFEKNAFTNGYSVANFEKSFAEYCNVKYAVTVNNGTSALHLALLTLNIGAGDEVIIPANTFIATAWSAAYVNAKPVFVDCTSNTWEIDPAQIEKLITKKTKAIIGVHLYGQSFDFDAVKAIADKHSLYLIEDAAQAHGTLNKGRKAGSMGDMACFSFYPGKNLGTYGEGGAVTTNNKDYAEKLQMLRNHGSKERYYHEIVGFNMRMGGVEGAVLGIKLKYLDKWNARRKDIANMYFKGITNTKITFQKQPDFSDSIFHLFVVTVDNRESFLKHLNSNDIFPGLHYPVPCHLQKAFSHLGYKKGDLPNSEYLSEHCVSLPMFAELTNEEVKKVIAVVNSYS
jgi:dTDP-4-amino-4,6-dideoxygalactose transaminase